MRTMLHVRNDICGAQCATSATPNGLDVEALESILIACPADAVERIAEKDKEIERLTRERDVAVDEWKKAQVKDVVATRAAKMFAEKRERAEARVAELEEMHEGYRVNAEAMLANARRHVGEICENLELTECWHLPPDSDGDCGNWPKCNPGECALAALRRMVGIVPQEDGGMDKQPRKDSARVGAASEEIVDTSASGRT